MAGTANIIPVVAKLAFDNDAGQFRMRVSTQVKRPDGTHYEVEIEVSSDLGALVTTLFSLWTGASRGPGHISAMAPPSPVLYGVFTEEMFLGTRDMGVVGDVGTADPADDLLDTDLI